MDDFIVGAVAAFVVVLIVLAGVTVSSSVNGSTEIISTQQYYSQSLQYLEDIRNSNDIIQANCTLVK